MNYYTVNMEPNHKTTIYAPDHDQAAVMIAQQYYHKDSVLQVQGTSVADFTVALYDSNGMLEKVYAYKLVCNSMAARCQH